MKKVIGFKELESGVFEVQIKKTGRKSIGELIDAVRRTTQEKGTVSRRVNLLSAQNRINSAVMIKSHLKRKTKGGRYKGPDASLPAELR